MSDKKISKKNADVTGPDGNEYKPMQYPMYRKIGDMRLFKLKSAEEFINVVDGPETAIIGWGIIAPAALAVFISSSSEATAEEYETIYETVFSKISS